MAGHIAVCGGSHRDRWKHYYLCVRIRVAHQEMTAGDILITTHHYE